MSINTHPFINYGIAVVMSKNNLSSSDEITRLHLINEIDNSINHFRVKPESIVTNQSTAKFTYCNEESGNPTIGVYLAPSVLATDKSAKQVFAALKKVKEELGKDKAINIDITRSITPIAGEFGNFGVNSIGRGKPKTSIETAAYCIISTSTHHKPSIAFKTQKKEKAEIENVAIIPDLELKDLVDFIDLFEKMIDQSTENLMLGNVNTKDGKPFRPRIFEGNFPNAPRSNSLGIIALLGSIGAWAKDAELIDWAKKVLDSLENRPIYLIGTKTFETYKYNHFIIELAKKNKLSSIIDSIYFAILYNQGIRNKSNRIEYQKFDLFVSRFLQLFNNAAFKDFLAFRAEYPHQLEILFKSYFNNMEKIPTKVVQSARELGKWLNYAAYKVADMNIEKKDPDRNNKIRELKAKSLIEIESSIFSARSGDALIFQAITRAGRASGLDAPAEAELFMTQAATGEMSLDSAKHLLIAFSRIRNKYEPKNLGSTEEKDEDQDADESEDFSDAQE